MPLKILSFFNEGVTWRVAQTPEGYCHRELSGMPDWLPGLPSDITHEIVESTFRQFSSKEYPLDSSTLSFKLTYLIGQSNVECFIFSSPEGDPLLVKIPPTTFATLQQALSPSEAIPRMRLARLVVQQAIHLGLPSVELLPDTLLYESVQFQLKKPMPRS
jgi:hypothetical protein